MTGFSNSGAGYPPVVLDCTRIDVIGEGVGEVVEDDDGPEDLP